MRRGSPNGAPPSNSSRAGPPARNAGLPASAMVTRQAAGPRPPGWPLFRAPGPRGATRRHRLLGEGVQVAGHVACAQASAGRRGGNPGAAGSAAARAGPNERRVSSRNQLSTTALE
jgi:hypothetical protein